MFAFSVSWGKFWKRGVLVIEVTQAVPFQVTLCAYATLNGTACAEPSAADTLR